MPFQSNCVSPLVTRTLELSLAGDQQLWQRSQDAEPEELAAVHLLYLLDGCTVDFPPTSRLLHNMGSPEVVFCCGILPEHM